MKLLNVNTNGNKKLKNSNTLRYMIWNLPSVKTCPFRTAQCEKSCYARKAERVYKQVLPSREKNLEESKRADFVDNMIYTIETLLDSRAYREKKAVFRIHESGDFYNLEYTRKWLAIVKHFEHDNRIVFLAYTKSILFFIGCGYGKTCLPIDEKTTFPKNIVIRSSIWADTCQKSLDLTAVYNFPIYTAYTEKQMDQERANGHKFAVCKCENCTTCQMCWNKSAQDIAVKIH